MTSKSKQLESQETEIDYEDMLLKRYRITESVIEEARKYNRDHGIDEPTSRAYVAFTKTNRQKKYERWLKQCKNPDTNQWYTMDFLKAKQLVARIDSPYDGRQYPRMEIFNLARVKNQSGEYLKRAMTLYALNGIGKEVSIYVDTVDEHYEPQIEYVKLDNPNQVRYMGEDEDVPGYGKTVAKVSNINRIYTDQEEGRLVYDTPFTEVTAQEFAKYARGAFNDSNNGCALAIKDESKSPRVSYSVFSLEQFLKPFDELYEELARPPKDNVNVKSLIKQLQDEKLLGKDKEANEVGVL